MCARTLCIALSLLRTRSLSFSLSLSLFCSQVPSRLPSPRLSSFTPFAWMRVYVRKRVLSSCRNSSPSSCSLFFSSFVLLFDESVVTRTAHLWTYQDHCMLCVVYTSTHFLLLIHHTLETVHHSSYIANLQR